MIFFRAGGLMTSIILIASGVIIWVYPDILERVLAIILIILGVSGLLSRRWLK